MARNFFKAGNPATPKQRLGFYACVGLLLLFLGIVFTRQGTPVFSVDDAYISLHSAQVLAAGDDNKFLGTPALTGATSAIHVALITAFLKFLPALWALQAVTLLAICCYAFGLAKLAFQAGISVPQAALVVLSGMTVALVPHQLTNGLETGLALAALVWTLVAMHAMDNRGKIFFPLLCGQLPFIRPELAAASLLLIIAHASQAGCRAEFFKRLLIDLGLMLAGALPWLLLYYVNTGLPYPSTIMAKKLYFAEGCLPEQVKAEWVGTQLVSFASMVGVLILALPLLLRTAAGKSALVFLFVFIAAYFKDFPGALGHYEQRYLYVFIPFLLFGIVSCLRQPSRLLRTAVHAILMIGLLQSIFALPERLSVLAATRKFTVDELDGVAAWAKANLPARSRLLIHDAGYIAFATDFHLTDIVGLKSPSSILLHKARTWPSCGAERHMAINGIAQAARPDYLVVLDLWDRIYGITKGLRAYGWELTEIRPSSAYAVYALRAPRE